MPDSRRIVQNPVLKLLTLPTREGITARGKSDARIKPKIFRERQQSIIRRIAELRSDPRTTRATHGSKVLVWVGLDEHSQSPTLTPGDLLSSTTGALCCLHGGTATLRSSRRRLFRGSNLLCIKRAPPQSGVIYMASIVSSCSRARLWTSKNSTESGSAPPHLEPETDCSALSSRLF